MSLARLSITPAIADRLVQPITSNAQGLMGEQRTRARECILVSSPGLLPILPVRQPVCLART